MPILDKKNKEQVDRYNQYIRNYKGASIMQTLNWGNVKKEGWSQEAVYVEKDGKIVSAMTILLKKLPGLKYNLLYASKGPVCDFTDINALKELYSEVEVLVKQKNGFAVRIDPELTRKKELEELFIENGYIVRNENVSKNDLIQPRFNMFLNIEKKTDEELLKQFSEKTRYNIRLSEKKGLTVRYSHNEEDLKKFFELYKVTCQRDNFLGRNYEYFLRMLNSFDEDTLRIYIVEHEGDILSSAITTNFGGKVWYMYGASSNIKRNLMSNYKMQWEMIKWGLETKCDIYDFGGVFILDKEDGLFKFKESFCRVEGVTELIGEIDKVYNKPIYLLFDKVVPFVQKIKKKVLLRDGGYSKITKRN